MEDADALARTGEAESRPDLGPDPLPEPLPDPLIGRNIGGKFVLEKQLGAGAMGAVYKARQTALEKTVAIKIMHGELARDPMFAARFHREAKAASRMDHPNSISILDYGQDPDGLLYIAMEFLGGRDLAWILANEQPLGAARAVDLLSQALGAIAVAHDLGITHRDIKPENIMVLRRTTDEGLTVDVVKVCDFGIAKLAEADDGPQSTSAGRGKLTTAGLVIGTPAYMSPEQGRGEVIDGRSDLYSMGIILYQMLTGDLPFDAPSAIGLVVMHQTVAPVAPSKVRSDVDPALEAVCLKALQKDRAARYQTARDFRAALRSALDPHAAVPPPTASSPEHVFVSAPALPRLPMAAEAVNARTELQMSAVAAPAVLSTGAGSVVAVNATEGRSVPPDVPGPRRNRWPFVVAGLTAVVALGVVGVKLQGSPAVAREPPPPPPASLASATSTPVSKEPSTEAVRMAAPAEVARGNAHADPNVEGRPAAADREPAKRATGRGMASAALSEQSAVKLAAHVPEGAPTPEARPDPPSPSPAPAPETIATPPLTVLPAPAAPPPAPFNAATASVEVGNATNLQQTGASKVNSLMGRVTNAINRCYQRALPLLTGTIEGTGSLHMETDDAGIITSASLRGGVRGAAAACIEGTVRGLKIDGVDTGSAAADVPLVFKAR